CILTTGGPGTAGAARAAAGVAVVVVSLRAVEARLSAARDSVGAVVVSPGALSAGGSSLEIESCCEEASLASFRLSSDSMRVARTSVPGPGRSTGAAEPSFVDVEYEPVWAPPVPTTVPGVAACVEDDAVAAGESAGDDGVSAPTPDASSADGDGSEAVAPDAEAPEEDALDDDSAPEDSAGSAAAIPQPPYRIAAPMPSAAAKLPTRPTCNVSATPIPPIRNGDQVLRTAATITSAT
ncbi:MAG: hypothetical protein K0R01_2366, partial [Mycobacterium sp.]|nr:hypothetical protein [Mycobacterium sp.]